MLKSLITEDVIFTYNDENDKWIIYETQRPFDPREYLDDTETCNYITVGTYKYKIYNVNTHYNARIIDKNGEKCKIITNQLKN